MDFEKEKLIDKATFKACAKMNGECVCEQQRDHVNPLAKWCVEHRAMVADGFAAAARGGATIKTVKP